MPAFKKIPKKYQPNGFEILYEDRDIIVGHKAVGFLTVAALYEKERTIHNALNQYVRKGEARSRKCVYVVHRLDRETSGVLMFAKTEEAKDFLKDNWKAFEKTYYAVVDGKMAQKSDTITSYLTEDEEYNIHSSQDDREGKLAHTAYTVIKETATYSLLKINLLTGRKNQIRVHLADKGHPVVGDTKYGHNKKRYERLALHSQSISFIHPFSQKSLTIETALPEFFKKLIGP